MAEARPTNRSSSTGPSGILVVDKEVGPSSFEIVQRVRRAYQTRRVGHGGTLDPFASGVLPICVGEGTKLAPYLLDADKEYAATLRLGLDTDTYDLTGASVRRWTGDAVSQAALENALARFRGTFEQHAPAYAAIKVQGRALYDYARKGEEAPRVARQVTVHELVLTAYAWPDAELFVRCSKGTYIRSLAHDVGEVLGVGGHLVTLRRLRSGPFSLPGSLSSTALDRASPPGTVRPRLLGLAEALAHWPTRVLDPTGCLALSQGKLVVSDLTGLPAGARVRVLREDGSLLAVATAVVHPGVAGDEAPSQLKPERVFHPIEASVP